MAVLFKFSLANFRNFRNLTEFELAPISILTGPNSSGKSSLTKAILLLRENVGENILSEKLECTGEARSLGYFDNVISHDSGSDIVEFRFSTYCLGTIFKEESEGVGTEIEFILKYKKQINYPTLKLPGIIPSGRLVFELPGIFEECRIVTSEGSLLFILKGTDEYDESYSRTYLLTLNTKFIFHYLDQEVKSSGGQGLLFDYGIPPDFQDYVETLDMLKKIERDAVVYCFTDSKVWPGNLSDSWEVLGLEDDELLLSLVEKIRKKLDSIGLVNLEILDPTAFYHKFERKIDDEYSSLLKTNPFERILYIPAERSYLSRTYNDNDNTFISGIIDQLKDRRVSINTEFLNKYLKLFNIGDSLDIISDEGSSYKFYINKGGYRILLADLGYGVTQLLPLLIMTSLRYLHTYSRETILIEEPELNLHPQLQSLLADFFVEAHQVMGKRFLIETHSEYLIRKMQYHTAKKTIDETKTLIYYLASKEDIAQNNEQPIKKIRILKDGSLSDLFGKGFYDEAIRLQLELMHLKNKN